MKRRHFISLASVGATGGLMADPSPGVAAPGRAWQPDGVGSRVPLKRGDARSFAEPPYVDAAVELLAALKPRAILYAFTSSSYVLGAEADDALRARLEARAQGVPVMLAAEAALEGLRTRGRLVRSDDTAP